MPYETEDGVATINLNRPKRNAVNAAPGEALNEALARAAGDNARADHHRRGRRLLRGRRFRSAQRNGRRMHEPGDPAHRAEPDFRNRAGPTQTFAQSWAMARAETSLARARADFRWGVAARLEERAPKFTGE